MSSQTIVHHEEPTYSSSTQVRAGLEGVLRDPAPIQWDAINGLLEDLSAVAATSSDFTYTSTKNDPLGRSLVSLLLSRNPPADVVSSALRVFPDSLRLNPVAFYTACRFSTPQIMAQMMKHSLAGATEECPYPWILSSHISAEGAKALLQAYPQGVLQASSCLSSFCPLDFFLMSPEMIKQRDFDLSCWTKFKLMLVAAECCYADDMNQDSGLSPVQVILKRILSRPGVLDDTERARHILWLLQQLCRSDRWIFEKQSPEGMFPLHFVLSHKCTEDQSGLVASRELVKLLLVAHPLSARHLIRGRLAIHMAVENGWPCHDLLLSLYPESLDIRDPATGFVPFQVAASSKAGGISLDVTFELFRANPMHVDRRLAHQGPRVGAQA